MTILDDIRRDMKAGTSEPWHIAGKRTIRAGESTSVASVHWRRGEANARRIARVPRLEAIALAAGELARAVDHERNLAVQDLGMQLDAARAVDDAIAALRKAMEEDK